MIAESALNWIKLKNGITYAILNEEHIDELKNKIGRPLEEALPLIALEDPLVKNHNKKNQTALVAGSVVAFLRADYELRTGQFIKYVFFRIVAGVKNVEELRESEEQQTQ